MQTLPHRSYERNMNHNYMVLSKCDFFDTGEEDKQDYRVRMLLNNSIGGLLPVSHRFMNGENKYYYEINSLQSMDRIYEKNEIGYKQLRSLLYGCISLYSGLEEYLLDGSQVILHPEYVYLNVESLEPYFVYYPYYEEDARESFARYIEELLKKIDHTDEKAVMLAYQVYRYTRNQNYVLNEIAGFIANVENSGEPEIKEPVYVKESFDYYDKDDDTMYHNVHNNSAENEEIYKEAQVNEKKGKFNGDLAGTVFCSIVALLAGGILAGSNFAKLYILNEKQQLYLLGALSMSIMAAVIFLACYFRKRNEEREIDRLQKEEQNMDEHERRKHQIKQTCKMEEYSQTYENIGEPYEYGDTICLRQLPLQEHFLSGRVNGEEIKIPLNDLPLTIGKMSGWADCVLHDNTVSKLHARIEERDGSIYLEDLNSTNGTLRNGTMLGINEPVVLEPGDELMFGRVSLRFYG